MKVLLLTNAGVIGSDERCDDKPERDRGIVKSTILIKPGFDPNLVYSQDSARYEFHFSESVGGGAHLCPKNFLFKPGLEPGVSPKTLAELRTKNIRLIYFTTGARECRPTERQDTPPSVRFYGFDQPIE